MGRASERMRSENAEPRHKERFPNPEAGNPGNAASDDCEVQRASVESELEGQASRA